MWFIAVASLVFKPALAEICGDGLLNELRARLGGAENAIGDVLGMPSPINAPFATEHIKPLAVVAPKSAGEIASILGLAAECNIPVAVRSNHGHSYIGQSTVQDGIVVHMASFQDVQIEHIDGEWIASVGGGVNHGHLYDTLSEHTPPLTVPAGACRSVGLSGLIQGGGYGLLAVNHGLTCDRVVSADVVVWQPGSGESLVTGLNRSGQGQYSLVHATERNEHAELLFALRGGLGGNYGVVTRWQLRAVAKPSNVTQLSIWFPASLPGPMIKVMKWLRQNDASGGTPLWAQFWFPRNAKGAQLRVMCHCWGSCEPCVLPLSVLRSFHVSSTSDRESVSSISVLDFDPFRSSEAWSSTFSVTQGRPDMRVFSMYFDDATLLKDEGIAVLFSAMQNASHAGISELFMQLDFHAGAMTRKHNTAFGHREPGWFNQVYATGTGVGPSRWSKRAWSTLLPFARATTGTEIMGYGNYIDSDKRESPRGFFASDADYARVQNAKCAYNPQEVFKIPRLAHMQVPLPATCHATRALLP
ncbi:xylO [Symbiodinium sp. CCMP2592]|nr:xylO [Symbiodinium sp. CCMP2592]